MDRQIVYHLQNAVETDLLSTNRNVMIALGKLAGGLIGTAGAVNGLVVAPSSPAALTVRVGPGEIYQLGNVDNTAYSSLPADTANSVLKQGIALTAKTLACAAPATAGYSINYLIQATYQDVDTGSAVLAYYNASNPAQAYSGPDNSGAAQATLRAGTVVVNAKAGTAATTGTQVTPTADTGYIALAVVAVANGQATITSGNITAVASGILPITNLPVLASGTYTPILTLGANAAAATVDSPFTYLRVGNAVTVSGRVVVTAAAAGVVTVEMDPPIASNFTAAGQCGGGGAANYSPYAPILISPDTVDKRVRAQCSAATTAATQMFFSFLYNIA